MTRGKREWGPTSVFKDKDPMSTGTVKDVSSLQ